MNSQNLGSVVTPLPVVQSKVFRKGGGYPDFSKTRHEANFYEKEYSESVVVKKINQSEDNFFNLGFTINLNKKGYRFSSDQIDVQDKNSLAKLKRENLEILVAIEQEEIVTNAIKKRDEQFQLMKIFEKTTHIFAKYTNKMSDLNFESDYQCDVNQAKYFKHTMEWQMELAVLSHEMARLFLKVDGKSGNWDKKPTNSDGSRPVMPVLSH